jgi:predicted amidophosphoribosyltransferase
LPEAPAPPPELDFTPAAPDEVEEFLAHDRPKPLFGAWETGWALAFNARFQGDRWRRTETGEWVYRLKYRGQREYAEKLGQRMAELIRHTPELNECDFMVPIPPSGREREFDPVTELILALSRHSGLPVSLGMLARTRQVSPQKDMESEAQKVANVRGLFRVVVPERLAGRKILLVDDFFDSGATLNECARTLAAAGARAVCVVTASKTIHHG